MKIDTLWGPREKNLNCFPLFFLSIYIFFLCVYSMESIGVAYADISSEPDRDEENVCVHDHGGSGAADTMKR